MGRAPGKIRPMSTQDTFAEFVDAVAATLDEPARGDELARRIHLSRAQLDRVVTGAAAEPPGRLRRRILLERAAFRLLEGDLGILEVAIEAGYSSHEAFTRAFQRAYGATPSTWRSSPGAVLIEAPNRVHFFPPGGLRLPSRNEVTSMDLVVTMTEHHIWLVGQMIDRASTLDEASLDEPIELSVEGIDENPTLRSLLSRLVDQMEIWTHAVANRPYDFTPKRAEGVESMRARLAHSAPIYLEHVRDACERGLDETFVDTTSGTPYFFTYGGMVAHVLTYAAHRRTLAAGALHSAGVTDLEDDPLAWGAVRPEGRTLP
jgi:AraC family transcriptional regulator